jgi:hypothetical protein
MRRESLGHFHSVYDNICSLEEGPRSDMSSANDGVIISNKRKEQSDKESNANGGLKSRKYVIPISWILTLKRDRWKKTGNAEMRCMCTRS